MILDKIQYEIDLNCSEDGELLEYLRTQNYELPLAEEILSEIHRRNSMIGGGLRMSAE